MAQNSQVKPISKTTPELLTNGSVSLPRKDSFVSGVKIFYASQTGMAKVGKNVDRWLWMLSAHRVLSRGQGDCNVAQSKHGSIEADFRAWKTKFISRLRALRKGDKKSCGGNCKKGKCKSTQHGSLEAELGSSSQDDTRHRDTEEEEPCESSSEEEFGPEDHPGFNSVVDVEDLGNIMDRVKKEKREEEQQEENAGLVKSTGENEDGKRRAMITPALREALTKQETRFTELTQCDGLAAKVLVLDMPGSHTGAGSYPSIPTSDSAHCL
ncbi:S-adenosyl-L-methionine-dependent tRNA 4-demethylwyosine synthase TYW1-like [Ochotona princeps]|uniref:S-adenosyl-L-methionine-dependent tRNA 4-demethylwyosine synthase TYW1-like n=1 Tax=Ochotona princeps TaxID=9978 RepID=UPI002714B598|nr:S-adenosyl-L-methionine-dependent tRNA 4-demethylwyosine synthase TYW1-like [Ochotona princeps]